MRWPSVRWGAFQAALVLAVLPLQGVNADEGPAYFVFEQESPKGEMKHFVFRIDDPQRVAEARAILGTSTPKHHVQGVVLEGREDFNPEWSFHLAPETIGFFELQTEVCDANVTYVEEHLAEVGGAFLPNRFWCPWSSKLVNEVTDSVRKE